MTGTDTLEEVADLIDELHAESKHVNDEVNDMLAIIAASNKTVAEAEQALNSIVLVRYDEMQTSQQERAVT